VTTSPESDPAAAPAALGRRTVRVALTGDLDYDTSDGLLHQVRQALHDCPDARELRLDCQNLGATDSTGLSTLLQIHRSAGDDGIGFHMDNIGHPLRRLLDLTGVHEYLTASHENACRGAGS
jgi:anti-anti-sigma factor